MFEDLRGFIAYLRQRGDVVTVEEALSVEYEIAAAIKTIADKNDAAAIFNRVEGYDTAVVGNLLGAKRRLAHALGVEERDLAEAYLKRRQQQIKPELVEKGPVKENILSGEIDLVKTIPVLTHHEKDAGPYFTTGVVISKDPETGIRGMGIHRLQVKGPRTLGILLSSPPVAVFLEKAEKKGEPLEIAIALGLDPVSFFSSVIWAPEGIDKFDIAGGLAGRPVPLVRCESVDLEVPAMSEFVLEGRVLPSKREREGPFGESTGYYFAFDNPVVDIQVITHRNEPIYHALMPFAGEEEVLINFSWQMENKRSFLESIPGLRDISIHHLGLITVAQVAKRQEGDGMRIIEALFDCGMPNKVIIAVDEDVDINNIGEVWWALATRFQPAHDLITKKDMRGLRIDPSAFEKSPGPSASGRPDIFTSKVGMDATKPLGEIEKFERTRVPPYVRKRIDDLLAKMIKGFEKGEAG